MQRQAFGVGGQNEILRDRFEQTGAPLAKERRRKAQGEYADGQEQVIQKIEAAVAESKAHPISEEVSRDVNAHHNENGDDNEHETPEPVSFATRAFPVLEMLHAAHKMQREVMWGV